MLYLLCALLVLLLFAYLFAALLRPEAWLGEASRATEAALKRLRRH